jgi:hypothetical protein
VQYELKNRVNAVYEKTVAELEREILDNGKERQRDGVKAIDFAHFVPIVNRQQAFTVWQSYDVIGRKIFFDLFSIPN